jgi:ATP-dependent Lhr-like helicase
MKTLYNVFEELHPSLRRVLPKYGFKSPTRIQEKAIPYILQGKSVIISSPTGTGKTEAAVLPVLSMMLYHLKDKGWKGLPMMIYISPLRALNRDLYRRLIMISNELGLRSIVRHGDSTSREREIFIKSPLHWFITTPESFTIMLSHPELRKRLSGIKWVVIDEIHELIDNERGSATNVSLLRLKSLAGKFQFIGLSATIPDPDVFRKFYQCPSDCVVVRDEGEKRIELKVVTVEDALDRREASEKLLEKMISILSRARTALVFTNTRDQAEYLGFKLREKGFELTGVHHGSLSLSVRKSVEEKLRKSSVKTVIATSSLELGIDIGTIDLVIQYGSPRQALRLYQRIGRSGHGVGKVSNGVIVAEPYMDDVVESLVTSRRAQQRMLEKPRIHYIPLDVMAHQIVGMVLSGEARSLKEFYDIFRKSFAFRGLWESTVKKVVDFLVETRMLGVRTDQTYYPSRRARSYYFRTTMIADTKKIPVYTIHGDRIGFLDEDYVASRLDVGFKFLLAGREWIVLDITESKVIVEEAMERTGLPPSWQGELIPVEHPTAREACSLVSRIYKNAPYELLSKEYPAMTRNAYSLLKRIISDSKKSGYLPPNPNYLLIEHSKDLIVLYPCLGTRGNNALATLISYDFMERKGLRVGFYTDPYRIFIELRRGVTRDEILEVLIRLSKNSIHELKEIIANAVRRTSLFEYKLLSVARKMGVVEKTASMDTIKKRLRFMRDTVAGEEAVREILTENIDVEAVYRYLKELTEKKIKFQPKPGLSPFTIHGPLVMRYYSVQQEGLPKDVVVSLLEKRIANKKVELICIRCGWSREYLVSNIDEHPVCPKCGSRAIVPIHVMNTDLRNAVKKAIRLGPKSLSREERVLYKEAVRRANLVLNYGKHAIIALTVYGVGSKGATRALSKLKLGWKEFLWALYTEERNYFRTRRYWK